MPNTQYPIPNAQHSYFFAWLSIGKITMYPIFNTQYQPDTIKHDQHTDRKNTTTLFFLKNSRVLLYVF